MKKADPSSFSGGKGTVPDPDLDMGGGSSRPLDKGRPDLKKNFFSVLRVSVWSKNKGGARAPALGPTEGDLRELVRRLRSGYE